MLYFALDRAGQEGYSELLSLASGRPLETVKYHQELPARTKEHMSRQTLPSPLQRTCDGYSLLRQLEQHFPEGVERDDMPLSYDQSHAGEGPTFANITELMAHISLRPTPDEQIVLSQLVKSGKKGSVNISEAIPKLRNGQMTTTANDWTARLHRAFTQLQPGEEKTWIAGLAILLQDIDSHRSLIRIRKAEGTEVIVDILRQMDFKVRDWIVRPPQERGGPAPDFRDFRTWRDISLAGRPLQLRPALPADTFSYEGARWAVLGHLLFLEVRKC